MNFPPLYLFRHGLATHSTTGYGDKILSAELLPEGIPAVERLATFLKTQPLGKAYVSEVKRCQQTAAIVTQITNQTFITDARINEYVQDTPETFVQRITNFLEEIQHLPNHPIAICTHGAVITTIKQILIGNSQPDPFNLDYPPTGGLWIMTPNTIEKHDFN